MRRPNTHYACPLRPYHLGVGVPTTFLLEHPHSPPLFLARKSVHAEVSIRAENRLSPTSTRQTHSPGLFFSSSGLSKFGVVPETAGEVITQPGIGPACRSRGENTRRPLFAIAVNNEYLPRLPGSCKTRGGHDAMIGLARTSSCRCYYHWPRPMTSSTARRTQAHGSINSKQMQNNR